MSTDLRALRDVWDRFGRRDPLWAVLSDDSKKHGRWNVRAFFLSGRVEVGRALARVDEVLAASGRTRGTGRALDFGCGVGRISQALSRHYERVVGVDIAPSMIRHARRYNLVRNRYRSRLRFVATDSALDAVVGPGSLDLVYTAHVLQHMEPRYAEDYVRAFVRLLGPGGVAMLELVTEPVVGAHEPMPDGAFRYAMTVTPPRRPLRPGAAARVDVRVTNTGSATWPAAGTDGWFHVVAGSHWRPDDVEGTRRAFLRRDVHPGQTCTLSLPVTAPTEEGMHALEVDLVQEGVDWFVHRGATPVAVDIPIEVATGWRARAEAAASALRRARGRDADDQDEPVMEMHGNAEADVRRWVAEAGGTTLAVFDWDEISRTTSTDWQRRGFVVVPT